MSMKPVCSSSEPGGSDDAPLSKQMESNVRKMNDLVLELQQESSVPNRQSEHDNAGIAQFDREREGILLQLQQEISNYVTIQEKFQEQEQSMQLIVQELEVERLALLDQLAVMEVQSSDNIDDLSKELDDLNDKLDEMSEDITCSICLSRWEADGSILLYYFFIVTLVLL